MDDLVISIINYKTKDLTADCIRSILDKKWNTKFEMVVVDNSSGDGSLEYLKKEFPKVNFIASDKNLGFAGGHNLALKKFSAKYYLLLNSDTLVLDGALDKMVEFLDVNPEIGIAGCKVLGFDGSLQPSGGDLPIGSALINWLFNLEIIGLNKPSFHRVDKDYFEKVHEVGWISGNFMMIKKTLVDKIGLLNDKYFMYFEDVEYCFRAQKAGFKIMINPVVSIKHLSGGSLDNPRFRQWVGEYQGLMKFYKQNFGSAMAFLVKLMIYKVTILRIIAFALIGKFDFSKTYAKVIVSI